MLEAIRAFASSESRNRVVALIAQREVLVFGGQVQLRHAGHDFEAAPCEHPVEPKAFRAVLGVVPEIPPVLPRPRPAAGRSRRSKRFLCSCAAPGQLLLAVGRRLNGLRPRRYGYGNAVRGISQALARPGPSGRRRHAGFLLIPLLALTLLALPLRVCQIPVGAGWNHHPETGGLSDEGIVCGCGAGRGQVPV